MESNMNQEQINLSKGGQPQTQQNFQQPAQQNFQQPQNQQNFQQPQNTGANMGWGQSGNGFSYDPSTAQQFVQQPRQGINENGVNYSYTYGMAIKDTVSRWSTAGQNGTLSISQLFQSFNFQNISNTINISTPEVDSSTLHKNFTNYISIAFMASLIAQVFNLVGLLTGGRIAAAIIRIIGIVIGMGIVLLIDSLFTMLSEQNPIKWKTWIVKVFTVLGCISMVITAISCLIGVVRIFNFSISRLTSLLSTMISLCTIFLGVSAVTSNFAGMNFNTGYNAGMNQGFNNQSMNGQNGMNGQFNQQPMQQPQNFQNLQQPQQGFQQPVQQQQNFQQPQNYQPQQNMNQGTQHYNGSNPNGF